MNIKTIGERLKAERRRLAYSQTAFGKLGSAGRTTVIKWERGTTSPNAVFLEAAAAVGVDVQYVITGRRGVHVFDCGELTSRRPDKELAHRLAVIRQAALLMLQVCEGANSPHGMAARALAATHSPLHNFDLLALGTTIENAAGAFSTLLLDGAVEVTGSGK